MAAEEDSHASSFSAHRTSVSHRGGNGHEQHTIKLSKSRVPLSATYDETLIDGVSKLVKEQKMAYKEQVKGYGWYDWLAFFIPCFRWLKTYPVKQWLLWDILAGLSVGAMVIPQGMSYANLAGLPQVYGLY